MTVEARLDLGRSCRRRSLDFIVETNAEPTSSDPLLIPTRVLRTAGAAYAVPSA